MKGNLEKNKPENVIRPQFHPFVENDTLGTSFPKKAFVV